MDKTEVIRVQMARKKLTQTEIGKRTGLSANTISAICNGKDTRISTLEAFAEVLDLSLQLIPKAQPAETPATT